MANQDNFKKSLAFLRSWEEEDEKRKALGIVSKNCSCLNRMRFGNSCNHKNLNLMSDPLMENIDDKIAHYFLGLGNNLERMVRQSGQIKCVSGDRWISAKHVEDHTINTTSPFRVAAACATYVLRNHVHDSPSDLFLNGNTFGSSLKRIDGHAMYGNLPIVNKYADDVGLKPETELYYVFNIGLDFMIQTAPVQATALLDWCKQHGPEIYGNRAAEIIRRSSRRRHGYYKELDKDLRFIRITSGLPGNNGDITTRIQRELPSFADYLNTVSPRSIYPNRW